MDFSLSEEQQILKDSAHSFLSKECTGEYVREMAENEKGYTPELWERMAELGWMDIIIPEEYGGIEGSFLDLAVLLYEMGYYCLPGPYFCTVVESGLALLEGGNDKQKNAILPQIGTGDQVLTVAWIESEGVFSPNGISLSADKKDDHFILSGTKLFVPYAHVADKIICAARTARAKDPEKGVSLFILDRESSGVSVQPLRTMAGDKQCELTLNQVNVSKDNLLGELDNGWSILKTVLQKAAVGKSAEMSGGARRVLDLAVPYTKEREQFGRPIGSFQAVKHHCANIVTYADTSRFMTFQAAWRISESLPFQKEASMCKAWVSDSYRRSVALAHQVMGGIGFMEEHDLHLYFQRAKSAELAFGDADFHREMVAQKMGL